MKLSIEGYGSSSALGVDAGVLATLDRRFSVAFLGRNINSPSIGRCEEELPVNLGCGVNLAPADDLVLCASMSMEPARGLSVSEGFELELNKHLTLRAGSKGLGTLYAGGFGFLMGSLSIDYGVMVHNPLGLTHGLGVCYTVSGR